MDSLIAEQSRSPVRRPYFAYGTNLNGAAMRMRCSGASFICTARLPGHRFIITARGVATIVPFPGRVVYGAIWRLTTFDEHSLDEFEGVPIFYRRDRIVVETLAGMTVDAFAYVATSSEPGCPRPGYLDAVLVGAAERDLPESYLAEIATWALPKWKAQCSVATG